ncbi:MAG: ribonuclease HII [Nanoarchaeota archaeon]
MTELVLGIDDAGRGPVIGPMVLAGCLINQETAKKFKKLGIKDSKQLTQKRREFFENLIKENAETFEITLSYPKEIDEKNHDGINLNKLEAIKTAEIINKINRGFNKIKVIVDCPSVSIVRWKDFLKTKIDNLSNLEISCEHKADKNHISVAAASILAKCVREKEMSLLKEKYGDQIGSGYCHDPITKRFLNNHFKKYKEDGIFRKTWQTWRDVIAKSEQRVLKF